MELYNKKRTDLIPAFDMSTYFLLWSQNVGCSPLLVYHGIVGFFKILFSML